MPDAPDIAETDAPVAPAALDKNALRRSLRTVLMNDLARLERSQSDSHEAATHAENRAEHAKDTRATEQSYLARGLAERVETLRLCTQRLEAFEMRTFDKDDPIALSALVALEDTSSESIQTWWLIPIAGGLEIQVESSRVRTVTPAAPLGRALIGLEVGEEGDYKTPRGTRHFRVRAIA